MAAEPDDWPLASIGHDGAQMTLPAWPCRSWQVSACQVSGWQLFMQNSHPAKIDAQMKSQEKSVAERSQREMMYIL